MAYTVASAFNEFKSKIALTEIQRQTVVSRQKVTNKYLVNAFPTECNLPLLRSTLIGSAQRNTLIRPLNDIDILAIFDNKQGIYEQYRNDSFSFINRIRNALNEYRVQIVGTRGQAVRLFYKEAPHVDIAPVFKSSISGYILPDGKGGWLSTDPLQHDGYLNQRNAQLNYELKPIIQLLKLWNITHGKNLKSFHIEIMAARLFTSLGGNSRVALEVFFNYANTHLSTGDPAGFSDDISSYLTTTNREQIKTNIRNSWYRVNKANEAEIAGNHVEAIRLWRIILGNDFPSYG